MPFRQSGNGGGNSGDFASYGANGITPFTNYLLQNVISATGVCPDDGDCLTGGETNIIRVNAGFGGIAKTTITANANQTVGAVLVANDNTTASAAIVANQSQTCCLASRGPSSALVGKGARQRRSRSERAWPAMPWSS